MVSIFCGGIDCLASVAVVECLATLWLDTEFVLLLSELEEEEELGLVDSLLLFVLWIGSAIIISEFDPELVLLLAELEEDEQLDCWLLLSVAINCLLSLLIVGWMAGLWLLDWVEFSLG